MTNRILAPVALFVYNRLENTRQVVEALRANYLAEETDLFIYSDAPKNERAAPAVAEVRSYLKTISGFKSVNVIERQENFYIERNIVEGVTEMVNRFGRVIVMEDDGVMARNFLNYVNDALDFYENKNKVMHVASFTFIKMPSDFHKTILWRYTENTGGGWATWKDRWDKFRYFTSGEEALSTLSEEEKNRIEFDGAFKCLSTLKLKPIPWDICWLIAVNKNNGLAVNPPRSLMKNIGLYGGTHFSVLNRLLGRHPFETEAVEDQKIIFEENLIENVEAVKLLMDFYSKLGKRMRDRVLNVFIRFLVVTRVTKLLKRILS